MNEIFLLSTHPVHFSAEVILIWDYPLQWRPCLIGMVRRHALSNVRASKLSCHVKLKSLTVGRVTSFTYQEYLTWFKSLPAPARMLNTIVGWLTLKAWLLQHNIPLCPATSWFRHKICSHNDNVWTNRTPSSDYNNFLHRPTVSASVLCAKVNLFH